MTSKFLPQGYKLPKSDSSYMKFQLGQNKFRIMTPAVIGWEGWKDNKPFRRPGAEQNIEVEEVDIDQKYGKPKINHFWAFAVWNYNDEKPMILEITQKSVMKVLENLSEDEDWGDPAQYDIVVEKIEKSGKTTYAVKPLPPKKISSEIQRVFDDANLDPEVIFKDGEDGFQEFSGHLGKSQKNKKR